MRRTSLALALVASLTSVPAEAKKSSPRARPERQTAPAVAPAPAEPTIPASSWQSLKNSWVEVTTREGQVVRGRLAGSDDTTATIVIKSGEVVPLQLRDAVALKQVAAPPPPPSAQPLTLEAKDADRVAGLEQRYGAAYGAPKGKKLHTAGAVVLSLGLTQVVIGVGLGVVSLIGGGDDVLGGAGLGLLLSGGVTCAVGGPLMVKGKTRRREYYDWLHQQEMRGQARLAPGFVHLRGGGGLSMRLAF